MPRAVRGSAMSQAKRCNHKKFEMKNLGLGWGLKWRGVFVGLSAPQPCILCMHTAGSMVVQRNLLRIPEDLFCTDSTYIQCQCKVWFKAPSVNMASLRRQCMGGCTSVTRGCRSIARSFVKYMNELRMRASGETRPYGIRDSNGVLYLDISLSLLV